MRHAAAVKSYKGFQVFRGGLGFTLFLRFFSSVQSTLTRQTRSRKKCESRCPVRSVIGLENSGVSLRLLNDATKAVIRSGNLRSSKF